MRNFKEREWLKIQLRGEFYNTFNRPNLSNPDTSLTNLNTFGKVTGSNSGRNMKLALIFFF